MELCINRGVHIEPMLVFADNITFFCRASHKSFITIKTILDEFTEFTGLRVNGTKSKITLSKRVQNGQELGAILGFQLQSLRISYLGTPFTG